MDNIIYFLLPLVSFFFVEGEDTLQISDNCSDILLARTYYAAESNLQASMAWLNIIDSKSYSQNQREASALIPGKFSGDYNSFNQARQAYFNKQNYNTSKQESESILNTYLPDQAIIAWSDCMQRNKEGLFFYLKDIDASTAIIEVVWKPGYSINKPLEDVEVSLSGGKSEALSNLEELPIGTSSYIIQRNTANSPVRGTLNASLKRGIFKAATSESINFLVPPLPVVKDLPSAASEPEPIEICACIGKGGVEGLTFWGPKGEPCNGISGWGDYSSNCVKVTDVASCTGDGNVTGVRAWGPIGEPCYGIPGWGTFSDNPTNLVAGGVDYCAGKGQGNILISMDLYGPSDKYVGGFLNWGFYQAYCK